MVFVVDDDPGFLEAIDSLLQRGGYSVCLFASAGEFLRTAPQMVAGCILLDTDLRELSGLELHGRLAAAGWRLPVLFLSARNDVRSAVQAIQAGAFDYIAEPYDPEELCAKIERAIDRQREAVAGHARQAAMAARYRRLTAREKEIFDLVVQGMSNKQIAAAIGTAEKTVKNHRASALAKLRVNSVVGLVRILDAVSGQTP